MKCDPNLSQPVFNLKLVLSHGKKNRLAWISTEHIQRLSPYLTGLIKKIDEYFDELHLPSIADVQGRFELGKLTDYSDEYKIQKTQKIAYHYIVSGTRDEDPILNWLAGSFYEIESLKESVKEALFLSHEISINQHRNFLLFLTMAIDRNFSSVVQLFQELVASANRKKIESLIILSNDPRVWNILNAADEIIQLKEQYESPIVDEPPFLKEKNGIIQLDLTSFVQNKADIKSVIKSIFGSGLNIGEIYCSNVEPEHNFGRQLRSGSKFLKNVTYLNLENNQFSDRCLRSLGEVLFNHETIKNASFKNCRIDENSFPILTGAVNKSKVNISWSNMLEDSDESQNQMQAFIHLEELDLSGNLLVNKEMSEIQEIYAYNPGIKIHVQPVNKNNILEKKRILHEFCTDGILKIENNPVLFLNHVEQLTKKMISTVDCNCYMDQKIEEAIALLIAKNSCVKNLVFSGVSENSCKVMHRLMVSPKIESLSLQLEKTFKDPFLMLSNILRHLALKELSVSYLRFDKKEDVQEFFTSVRTSGLKSLKLCNVYFGFKISEEISDFICSSINENPHLENLSFNNIPKRYVNKIIIKLLEKSVNLKKLELINAQIDDKIFLSILKILFEKDSLGKPEELDLSHNKIGMLGLRYFLHYLEIGSLTCLKVLNLENNAIDCSILKEKLTSLSEKIPVLYHI